ncbi:MAG: bifunctional diaminohydroxyphosphoribosylaminopyrimidine deaminase/5-amino-6-(5-phosphoribosylamino)uracil reductase RibD [Myxococcales bacterium]|nr:bifunctional diaminohydroxyphosphoribosylaminopyrimidine deaminase/5-amino-6-(5-phosphoribosylamino)uracil reductase RibD [Myxococcales bacterium]MCB9519292.1 bifunctional diaminohydroxyphosphoribosylaminopyrimidine deaminase/5-amino-6-(5-phosphoribosylamino)uracil reductase RibD [Myxococcales bacterium]MCB9530736.1 bifunctional diaminohydroxyphosphoribosylaminopyrimidine deaminase/5-amino-6-(5-phosphoribosylamino)uracil reductase RibD [Myxococcales bacterium]MCB9533370.1 bifunctional diamino
MRAALAEAVRGRFTAHPNPMVGVALVDGDRVVATGFHARAGGPHAERVALDEAGERARGTTMYVNLEPCSHFGRTPPCADAVIAAGIRRVVVGMIDPNPLVSGEGLRRIEAAGIATTVGVLGDACWALNLDYIIYIRERRPMVTAKLATSLDGRIATRTGASKWITGAAARHRVHEMRRDATAILVGRNTVVADDPSLTTRLADDPGARSPHRFVVDARLDTPPTARVADVSAAPTTFVCTSSAPPSRRQALIERGAEVIELEREDGRVDVEELLFEMGRRGLTSLLVEGGGELVGDLADRGLVDRLATFTAPVVLGGRSAIPSIGGTGVAAVDDALRARALHVEKVGDDVLLVADFSPHARPRPTGDWG